MSSVGVFVSSGVVDDFDLGFEVGVDVLGMETVSIFEEWCFEVPVRGGMSVEVLGVLRLLLRAGGPVSSLYLTDGVGCAYAVVEGVRNVLLRRGWVLWVGSVVGPRHLQLFVVNPMFRGFLEFLAEG